MTTRPFALILGIMLTWCGGVAAPSPSVDSSLPASPAISSPAVSSSGEPGDESGNRLLHIGYPLTGATFFDDHTLGIVMRDMNWNYQAFVYDLEQQAVISRFNRRLSSHIEYMQFIGDKLAVFGRTAGRIDIYDLSFTHLYSFDVLAAQDLAPVTAALSKNLKQYADYIDADLKVIDTETGTVLWSAEEAGYGCWGFGALEFLDEHLLIGFCNYPGAAYHETQSCIIDIRADAPITLLDAERGSTQTQSGAIVWGRLWDGYSYRFAEHHRVTLEGGVPSIQLNQEPEIYENMRFITGVTGVTSDYVAYQYRDDANPLPAYIVVFDSEQNILLSSTITLEGEPLFFESAQISPDGKHMVGFDRLSNLYFIDLETQTVSEIEIAVP